MPKTALLILISFLLLSVPAAAQDAALEISGSPGIARFPYTKAPDGEPANLINASTYAFSAQSGIALEDMSTGTTQLIGPGSDNVNSALTNIGFLYRYDGVFFTNFGVNTNGLLRLGGVSVDVGVNALNSSNNAPKITPYWDTLCTANSGKVHYKLVPGPVGTQKLVVEWKNMKINRGAGCDGSGDGTFQLWLYDRTGVIQFVYGTGMTGAAPVHNGYSVGIQSGAATNFASVTIHNNSVSYTTANNTQLTAIPAGTSYLFSPNIPAAATGLNATAVGQNSVTVNWTDNAVDETTYLVRRTTDMVDFYFVADTLPPNSTTFTDTGLAPGTQYFYFVNALTDGAFGPDASLMVTTTGSLGNISSTPAGGPWSAPSTWVGGTVPDTFANVTISGGSTVTIDTASAVAGNVTVSPSGVLKFGETGAFKLTVTNNVAIDAGGTFSTGGGNANQHILSVGRNLTNNGTLDFSTNNNQAAAGIVFTGATSNTFGGTGAVTDIFTLTVNKGPGNANILDLAPANFTVQGSTTDGPGSGFLYLNGGTFKISGSFAGTHRTFANPNYQVIAAAGLWLNNPNYTIAAQNGSAGILGLLRVSAGTYNVGTATPDGLTLLENSTVLIEGGSITVAGSMGLRGLSNQFTARMNYTQTAGTVTTCTIGRGTSATDICFDVGQYTQSTVTLSGGDIVIQNSQTNPVNLDYRHLAGTAGMAALTNTTLHFGNALTTGSGFFTASGRAPNVVLSANHSLSYPVAGDGQRFVRNFTIEQGAVLHGGVTMHGDQFVNNGTINATTVANLVVNSPSQVVTYSGSGIVSGVISTFSVNAHSLAISPASSSTRVRILSILGAAVTGADRFIIGNGNNDNIQARIEFLDNVGSLDLTPGFDHGPGGLLISYRGWPRTTGPEIPANRIIPGELRLATPGLFTLAGGDLTVDTLTLGNSAISSGIGILNTGGSTITALVNATDGNTGSYVDGNLRRRINNTGFVSLPVGQYSPALNVTARTTPSYISVMALNGPLPGLLPSSSVQHHWRFVEEGDVTSTVFFIYPFTTQFTSYRIWRSTGGGAPQEVPFDVRDAGSIRTVAGITEFTGDWGIGALDPGPVSISGRVTTAGGNPIRNAAVTISGGNLQSPVTVLTGSFGTYVFSGLQAGVIYNISASAKRYRFPAGGQNVTPEGNVENLDFVANPQDE